MAKKTLLWTLDLPVNENTICGRKILKLKLNVNHIHCYQDDKKKIKLKTNSYKYPLDLYDKFLQSCF